MTRALATGFTMPRAIAVVDGAIFVADTELGTVERLQGGARSIVAEIDSPLRLCASPRGPLVTSSEESGAIHRIGPDGAKPIAEELTFPAEIVEEPDGTVWFTCSGDDRDNGYVARQPPSAEEINVVGDSLTGPQGLVLTPEGPVVIDGEGDLVRVNAEGRQDVLVAARDKRGGERPVDLAAFLSRGHRLVLDTSPPVIHALASGDGTLAWIGRDGLLRRWRPGLEVPPNSRRIEPTSADVVFALGRFFAVEAGQGRIVSAPPELDAPPRVLVNDEPGIRALAVGGGSLYYSTATGKDGGGVLKVIPLVS